MISVALLTFNQFLTGRDAMFRATLASIEAEQTPHTLDIVTNGSTDRTDVVVRKLGGTVDNRDNRPFYGMELGMRLALAHEPDIVVLSADDLTYRAGWMDDLTAFWADAPDDIVLASLFLEGTFEWNTVTDALDIGGQRVLIRDSLPSASWSFRARDAHLILPLDKVFPGEDLNLSRKLRAAGYRLAALEFAAHTGAQNSAWRNMSWQYEQPLDRQKWGLS